MRGQMLDMMIEKTKGNKKEMMKLVNSFIGNAEMKRMIMDTRFQSTNNEYSLQPRGIMDDSVKLIKWKALNEYQKNANIL